MNRRGFLRKMIGGAASAAVAPVVLGRGSKKFVAQAAPIRINVKPPPYAGQSFTDLVSTTMQARKGEIERNVMQSNAILRTLRQRGYVVSDSEADIHASLV